MNCKEALEEIRKKNPKISLSLAERILSGWEKCGNTFYKSDIPNLIKFIWLMQETEKQEDVESRKILLKTDENPVTSEIIVKRISPLVRGVRKQLFGTETPFSSIEEVDKWLDGFIEKIRRPRPSSREIALRRLAGLKIQDEAPPPYSSNINRIRRLTGWTFADAFLHIFLGIVPPVPRFRLRSFQNKRLGTYLARLDIYSKDLTFKELQSIYKSMRAKLNITKKKPLKDTDYELYNFMEVKKGEVKTKKKGEKADFWQKALNEWNSKHSERQFETYRGLQVAYKRTRKRLGAL